MRRTLLLSIIIAFLLNTQTVFSLPVTTAAPSTVAPTATTKHPSTSTITTATPSTAAPTATTKHPSTSTITTAPPITFAPTTGTRTPNDDYFDGTSFIWFDASLGSLPVLGVIVHFNYGNDNLLYTDSSWRSFCTSRQLGMVLLPDQDNGQSVPNMQTSVSLSTLTNALSYAARQSGHSELSSASLPYIFTGVSRGGTLGALNLGWSAGADKTIALIAFHGDSLMNYGYYFPDMYSSPFITSAALAIPVLYKIDQFDSTLSRQTTIESQVREVYFRPQGAPWTTSMDYGYSHATTGSDVYMLQWLGRVIDVRYNPNNKGKLSTTALQDGSTIGMYYNMIYGASTNCHFGNNRTAPYKVFDTAASSMIWLPPFGVDEWLTANILPSTPQISSFTVKPLALASAVSAASIFNVTVNAADPFAEPLSFRWSVQSKPLPAATVTFGAGGATNQSAIVTFSTSGAYVLTVTVTNSLAMRSATQTVSVNV